MGWNYYLVDEEEKTLVSLGNKVSVDSFKDDLVTYKEFTKMLWEFDEKHYIPEDIKKKKIVELSLDTIRKLTTAYDMLSVLSETRSSFSALDYAERFITFESNLEFIYEDDAEEDKYKDWTVIE